MLRNSYLCYHQSWPIQSIPMHSRLWQAACLLQQPLIYQLEIHFPLHFVFKNWLNLTMSLPQLWITLFVNMWSIHSFEEWLSGDCKFCNQLFAMHPFITIITTTQHSANKRWTYALCFDKAVPSAWVYDCPVMWWEYIACLLVENLNEWKYHDNCTLSELVCLLNLVWVIINYHHCK